MLKRLICVFLFFIIIINVKASDSKLFTDIPGWKMKVNSKVYNSEDLWELIDGAAEIFLSYNFENLNIAEYSKKDELIRVELYKHKSPEDAFGIYTSERMPDYPPVSIGTQGYKSQGIINYFAGPYYVKIMSIGTKEANEQTITTIAEKVDAFLSQKKELPIVLSLFPPEGKVTLSDTYTAQNFLGYSFFHHAFSMKYNEPTDFQLFIINLSSEEINTILDQYLKMLKEDKIQVENEVYIISDLFNGTIYLKKKDKYLIGVINTINKDVALDYINRTESNILN